MDFKVLCCVLSCLSLLSEAALSDSKMRKLLEKKLADLEDRLVELQEENDELKSEVTGLKLMHGNSLVRRQTFGDGTAPGFTARISKHLSGLGKQHAIIFDSVQTNHGNGYDNITGYFIAPEPGIYVFFANIMSEQGQGNEYIETEIVKNGQQLAEMYSGGSALFDSTSNLAVTSLEAGDHVWVRVHGSWSSNYAVHCCFSTFSGFLIGYNEDMALIG